MDLVSFTLKILFYLIYLSSILAFLQISKEAMKEVTRELAFLHDAEVVLKLKKLLTIYTRVCLPELWFIYETLWDFVALDICNSEIEALHSASESTVMSKPRKPFLTFSLKICSPIETKPQYEPIIFCSHSYFRICTTTQSLIQLQHIYTHNLS